MTLSPALSCALSGSEIPNTEPAFSNALQQLSKKVRTQAQHDRQLFLMKYVPGMSINTSKVFDSQAVVDMMVSLYRRDCDPMRIDVIKTFLIDQGCPDVWRDRQCALTLEPMTAEDGDKVLESLMCQYFVSDLVCVSKVLLNSINHMSAQIEQQGLSVYRHQNKTNTETTSQRADYLYTTLTNAFQTYPNIFATPPQRILIIGPGLETVHPQLGVTIPMQSYEPFAIAEAAMDMGAWPAMLAIDIVDIDPLVIAHWEKTGGTAFKVIVGNIITDPIGNNNTYDLVVMMNVLPYFSNAEKIIAFDNIARILRPGGNLITELGEGWAEKITYPTSCPQTAGQKLQPALLTSPGNRQTIFAYQKN